MAGQKITFNPSGLFTNVNSLGKIPPGGLLQADNTVISKPGIIESRRGRKTVWFTKEIPPAAAEGLAAYRLLNAKLRIGGDATNGWLGQAVPGIIVMLSDGTIVWSPDGDTFTKVVPIWGQPELQLTPVEGDRHWYAFEQNGTIYISTVSGVIAIGRPVPNDPAVTIDRINSGYYPAGVSAGLSMSAEEAVGGSPTAVGPDSQVAYHFCFGYRDASGITHLGAPTTRKTFVNANAIGGAYKNVVVGTTLPPGINPNRDFYQVYRSLPSPGAGVDPGDDCGLIYEGQIPPDSHIDQMSRNANVVTARTTTVNGYSQGQYILLLSSVDIPGSISDLYVSVYGQGAYTGGVANHRQVNTRHGNTGTWTALGGATFDIVDSAGAPISSAVGVPFNILLKADKFNNKIYYMESYSPWVYILNANGTYSGKVAISCLPLLAAYDEDRRQIRIVGMQLGKDKNENLTANGTRKIVFQTDGDFTSGTIDGGVLPGGFDALGNAVPVTAETLTLIGKIGLFRNGLSGPTYITMCVWTGSRATGSSSLPYFAYSTSGASWIVSPMTAPLHDPGVGTVNRAYVANMCGNYTRKSSDGSYISYFGLSVVESSNIVGAENYCETYYFWQGGGLTNPALIRSTYKYAAPSAGIYTVATGPRILSVYMHPDTGNGLITIANIYESGISDSWIFNLISFTGTPWTFDLGIASPTVTPQAFGAYPTGWAVKLPNTPYPGSAFPGPMLTGGYGTCNAFDNGAVKQALQFGTYQARNRFAPFQTEQSVATFLWSWPNTYSQQAPPWPLLDQAPQYEAGAALTATVVNAGIYKILSIIDPTHFTIASVGTDFANYGVSVDARVTSVSLLDAVYPVFIGPFLYTSPVQEGAIAANRRPPLAKDITIFRTYAFYANCTQPASVKITLLSPASIVAGDRLMIGSSICVAGATEDAQLKQFKVYSTGPSNFVSDVQNTIASIATVVNINWSAFGCTILPINNGVTDFASFFISAESFSGTSQFVNKVSFKHVPSVGTTAKTTAFAPYDIIVSPEAEQNVIYYSKSNIPDAVPFFNSIRVGQDSKPIRRILASRDSLFIFKDDGCFILRGYEPPWQVDPYDLTLQLSAIDSLSRLDNALYGLFTRGVFRVSDSSVELLSLPIQDQLERYMAGDMQIMGNNYGFGVGDNSDHKYLLWLPSNLGEVFCESDIVFVYDTYTQTWTKWNYPSCHAMSYIDIKLMFAGTETIEEWHYDPVTQVAFGMSLVDYRVVMTENKTLTDLDLNDGAYYARPVNNPIPPGEKESYAIDGTLVYVEAFPVENKMRIVGSLDGGESLTIFPAFSVKAGDYIEYAGDAELDTRYSFSAVILEDADPNVKFGVSANLDAYFGGTNIYLYRVYRGIRQTVMFAPSFPESPAASNHFSEYALSFRKAYWDVFHMLVTRPIEETDIALPVGTVTYNGIEHFGLQDTLQDSIVPTHYPTYDLRIGYMNFLRTYVPRDQQRGTVIFPGYSVKIANSPAMVDGIYIVMTPGPTSFTRR